MNRLGIWNEQIKISVVADCRIEHSVERDCAVVVEGEGGKFHRIEESRRNAHAGGGAAIPAAIQSL